jgi:Extensin-like protein C-terminus
VAHWMRDDVAPEIAALGTSVRGVETADSFDCRPRNGVAGAKISEHGRANALDVRAFKLGNRKAIELTNARESKPLRERLRDSACTRFSTVLGNGADAYHESHVHLDLIERHHNYRICEWEVLDEEETADRAAAKAAQAPQPTRSDTATAHIPLPRPRPQINSQAPSRERHATARVSRRTNVNR